MNLGFEDFCLSESLYPVPKAGEKKRYLLMKDEKSELILMIWGAGARTPIHDHAGSDCWTKLLRGKLVETTFTSKTLQVAKQELLEANGFSYVDKDGGLHQLTNDTSDLVYTLHLYKKPLSHCNIFERSTQKWIVLENHYDSIPMVNL